MRYGITPNQLHVYRAIRDYITLNDGIAPTHNELRKICAMSSRQVKDACDELRARGWIDWLDSRQRSFGICPE